MKQYQVAPIATRELTRLNFTERLELLNVGKHLYSVNKYGFTTRGTVAGTIFPAFSDTRKVEEIIQDFQSGVYDV